MIAQIPGMSRAQVWEQLTRIAGELDLTIVPAQGMRGKRNDPQVTAAFMIRPLPRSDKFRSRGRAHGDQSYGARINATCYHGHYFFMRRFFREYPNGRIASSGLSREFLRRELGITNGILDYDGERQFQIMAPEVSRLYPPGSCDCLDWNVGGEIDPADIPTGRHD